MVVSVRPTYILFKRMYSPNRYMAQRYPKAAKKRRVRKKWLNRFGMDIEDMVYLPSPLLAMLPKTTDFYGAVYLVPF